MPRLLRYASLALLACAAGCATAAPVVRLHPLTQPSGWAAGAAVVALEQDGVRVASAFAGQRDGMVGLRVEVWNGSDTAFTLDPALASYAVCTAPPTPTRRPCGGFTRVRDPERLLLDLDLARSRAHAAKESAEAAGTVLVLLNVVGGVASIASGDGDSAARFADGAADAAITHDHIAAGHAHRAHVIASTRQGLEAEVMRKSTVVPGQAVAGTIYLPLIEQAQVIEVTVPVRGARYQFAFRQTLHRP